MDRKALIQAAIDMRNNSYSPYSDFTVGAALLTKSGKVYTGCNIENAGYTPSNCAERTAFFKAVSEGHREFSMIAVSGGKKGKAPHEYCAPCGVCRQVMMEFCDPKTFQILLVKSPEDYIELTLEELLPMGFGPASLSGE